MYKRAVIESEYESGYWTVEASILQQNFDRSHLSEDSLETCFALQHVWCSLVPERQKTPHEDVMWGVKIILPAYNVFSFLVKLRWVFCVGAFIVKITATCIVCGIFKLPSNVKILKNVIAFVNSFGCVLRLGSQ